MKTAIAFILMTFGWITAAPADASHFVTLDVPGSTRTVARGINNNGQVVGSFTQANVTSGFLYSGGAFSAINVPGGAMTNPSAIDGAGRIVGFYLGDDASWHGFLYADSLFSTLDMPGATATRALGMNDLGAIVGAFTDGRGEHGFLSMRGAFTSIDMPDAVSTSATGVNNAGEIVGIYTGTDSRVHGFLYVDGVFLKLDAPGEIEPGSLAINDASQIVGFPGLLYNNGVFVAIDDSVLERTDHGGIDNAGQVAGSYVDASGVEHGFIATFAARASVITGGTATSAGSVSEGQAAAVSRIAGLLKPQVTSGACDLNANGVVNVSDVQVMINEALGVTSAVNDLNGDHVVNVADVQIVINAALGLGCAATGGSGTGAVSHLIVQSGNGQVACICFTATLQAFQPISVKATDINGNPVAGATVTWTVTSGQMTVGNPTSVTDSSGVAKQNISLVVFNNFSSAFVPYLVSTVQATSNNNSVIFTETQSLITSQGASVILANPPQFGSGQLGNAPLSAAVGTTLTTPIQTNIGGIGIASNGVPNVSVRILNQQTSPTLTCGTGTNADPGSVLSDMQGNTNCYPTFSGTGSGTYYLLVGGLPATSLSTALDLEAIGPFSFTSLAGAPAAMQIVSGNNQVVAIGSTLNPLVAKVLDAQGHPEPGQSVTWTVSPANAVSLFISALVTDANGQVMISGNMAPGAAAGVSITVTLVSNPSISATFHATVPSGMAALAPTPAVIFAAR